MGLFKSAKKGIINYTKIKLREKLDYDMLLEIIKDGNYPMPQPEITGKGMMRAIRFQPTGNYQIMVALSGKTISISNIASGVKGMATTMAMDSVTNDFYGVFNKENLDGNEMVVEIGKEVRRLLEEKNLLV